MGLIKLKIIKMEKFIKITFEGQQGNSPDSKISMETEGLTGIEVIGALRYLEKEMFIRMCKQNEPKPKKDENETT